MSARDAKDGLTDDEVRVLNRVEAFYPTAADISVCQLARRLARENAALKAEQGEAKKFLSPFFDD